jgi:hypothetical protein
MLRSLTAGFAAMLGVGLVLAPAATSARSGGFAAGRAFSFHGAPRAPVVRPAIALSPLRHRRNFGSPVTVSGGSGDAAGYDQGPLLYPAAADGAPDQGRIVYVPPPPGCRSDTKIVPSEAGGERKITITRCWR